MKRKKWVKPVLTVLVRGGQEEAVLTVCRQTSSGAGAASGRTGCRRGSCGSTCSTDTAS